MPTRTYVGSHAHHHCDQCQHQRRIFAQSYPTFIATGKSSFAIRFCIRPVPYRIPVRAKVLKRTKKIWPNTSISRLESETWRNKVPKEGGLYQGENGKPIIQPKRLDQNNSTITSQGDRYDAHRQEQAQHRLVFMCSILLHGGRKPFFDCWIQKHLHEEDRKRRGLEYNMATTGSAAK